ncbi:MAG: UDP-glucuronic acid decarboxylase family protein [Planctomycetota bacterium]|nr:UDP-glucuronic acid decarboxylase family protein [Planctomycetota bacterium]MEC8769256.1 UDP-glucuronic acid decarboxylase family protein [Planctomycetota bacterium]
MGNQGRILVTGGSGFLGASLCERLVQAGHEVICLDNLLTSSIDNIEHLLGSGNFKFIEHDVTEPIRLEVDEIYNLACPASPMHYQANPIKTMKTSVLGMIHVLGMAKRCGARVLQASTSEIYGDPDVHPQPESYRGLVNTLGPRACYDEGKRAAEALCSDYRRSHDVEVRIARIFNTYGPGMATNDGRVVSNFILQTLRGEPVTVYGDGSQTRSFCYRDDLIEGLVRLMALDGKEPRPVNLGNPEECSMLDLVQAVARACGREATVTYQPIPNDDPKQRCPDITRARELLNWSPAVSLQEGLQRTVSWFQNQT